MQPSPCKTKNLILLGASGSIGKSTLDYLKTDPEKKKYGINIVALSVHSSLEFLKEYLSHKRETLRYVCVSSKEVKEEARELSLLHKEIKFFYESDGLVEMLEEAHGIGADTVMVAVVGSVGIMATLRAIQLGMKVTLANKESLVLAGSVVLKELRKRKLAYPEEPAFLLPVDSEHNSVFRIIEKMKTSAVHRIILTASGGSLRDLSANEIKKVTKAQVLKHPNWSMGAKINVDSASMINKGLELIEAHYLFEWEYSKLEAYIHRHSLVHALVECSDGSYLFHASFPDMSYPIAHTLFYPEPVPHTQRAYSQPLEWSSLEFSLPNREIYPGFYLSVEVAKQGLTAPAIFNATNEVAVAAFLEDKIHFTQIVDVIKEVLDEAILEKGDDLPIFLDADAWARSRALHYIKKLQ